MDDGGALTVPIVKRSLRRPIISARHLKSHPFTPDVWSCPFVFVTLLDHTLS